MQWLNLLSNFCSIGSFIVSLILVRHVISIRNSISKSTSISIEGSSNITSGGDMENIDVKAGK